MNSTFLPIIHSAFFATRWFSTCYECERSTLGVSVQETRQMNSARHLVRRLISSVVDFGNSQYCGKWKIRISKSEIRNNIKMPMFKIQNKPFDHSHFDHSNLFRVSIFEFRISVSLGSGSNTVHNSRIS